MRRGAPVLLATALLVGCGPKWNEYRSEEGKFAVAFPGEPLTEHTRNDGTLTIHIVTRTVSNVSAYGVAWYDIADPGGKSPAELMQEVQERALRETGAALNQAGDAKLGEHPGRFFVAQLGNGLYIASRIYAVGTNPVRIYHLTGASPHIASGDVQRFFHSLKLLK